MIGHRLPDVNIGGGTPIEYTEDPGAYWRVLARGEDRPLDVLNNLDDRRYWGAPDAPHWSGNLTGHVYGVVTPDGRYGMLSIHTVREHEDDTITVAPGDGSSNSILISGGSVPGQWHGYIDHGVWRSC